VRRLSEKGNERQGFVDPADFAKVLAALPDDLKDFCAWCYVTGQRKGEAGSLTWSMIEDDSLRIPGRITKNGKDRVLPLVGELGEIIERRQLARRIKVDGTSTTKLCDLVFHRNGAPVRELRKSWKTATRKAGCPGLLLHDLRRSACRNLRRAGVPEQVAMQVSGHRTTSIFQRYSLTKGSNELVTACLDSQENTRRSRAWEHLVE
jgi:integrase